MQRNVALYFSIMQGRLPRRAYEIFDATLDLLAAHGYDGLTIEGVAHKAGVNKTTIYRWWPSKAALLRAALIDAPLLQLQVPDTGSLRGDLVAIVLQVQALLTEPASAAVAAAALGGAGRHPELAELARAFSADRLAKEAVVFERAAARGELPAGADRMLVMDAVAGAVWVRLLVRQTEPGAEFAERVVDLVLDGLRPRGGYTATHGSPTTAADRDLPSDCPR